VVIDRISSLQPELLVSTASTLDGQVVSADVQFSVDERETTQIVLEIVAVAENNGLKLPREFGLLLKQALYFDRYQKLLAPSLDPLRDPRVRGSLAESGELFAAREGRGAGSGRIIDAEIVQ
jgi:aarF domain-containing kinase